MAIVHRAIETKRLTLEGIARKNWPWDEDWYDSANYALLREDWTVELPRDD